MMQSAGTSTLSGGIDLVHSAGPTLVWLVVVSFVFLECALIIGLFLPGDSLLITAGIALSAHSSGSMHVWALSIGAFVAATAGNQVGYVIGHRTGHRLIARKDGKYVNRANLEKVNGLLEKHGFWAVLIARWIPWVRTLCPLVAGAAGMNHRKYTVASTIGAIIWAPVLLLVGFYCGGFLEKVPWLFPAVLTAMIVTIIGGTILGIIQYRREMHRPIEVAPVHEVP